MITSEFFFQHALVLETLSNECSYTQLHRSPTISDCLELKINFSFVKSNARKYSPGLRCNLQHR